MTSDPIITALEQQVGCYRRLAELVELQRDHVRHGRTEELLAVLRSRQEVLEQVATFEQVVGPAKRRWAGYLDELGPQGRTMVQGLVAETRQLLERITASDRDDALLMQRRKLNVGRQAARPSSARKVNPNYAALAYSSAARKVDFQQ